MSMMSPRSFVSDLEDAPFSELVETRRRLVEELEQLEREFEDPDPTEAAWLMDPGPDVRYKMVLEYLSELCRLMERRAGEVTGEVLEDEELEGLDDDYRQWR